MRCFTSLVGLESRYTMVLTNKNRATLLRPWVKIELEAPFLKSERDGKSPLETNIYPTSFQRDGRLYLLLPQLLAKMKTRVTPFSKPKQIES